MPTWYQPNSAYLLGAQHHRDHTLWLSGLGALINQDGAELHLGQTGVTSANTGAADHISILDKRDDRLAPSYTRPSQETVLG